MKLPKKIIQNLKFKVQNFIIVFFVLTFNFALLTFNLSVANAQTSVPLLVAPSRQELTVNPGDLTGVDIKFLNQSDKPITGLLKAVDFIVENKEGIPTLIEEETQTNPRFAAATWFSLPYDRITIGAKNRVLVNARINVPQDARAGGRYVAVFFEPTGYLERPLGADKEAGVATAIRIASLIYLRVSGPINEGALVTQFTAPAFSQYGPVTITSEILNRGDYHIRPKGVITVTDFLGRLIGQSLLEEQNIFPDVSITYQNVIGKKWMFGRLKADLQAAYGEKGRVLTSAIYFWVFPWKETTVVVLTLVILVLLLTGVRRRTTEKEKEMAAELKEKEKELKKLREELKKKESE